MARKIVYKKSGLNSQPTTPNGYKFVGYDNDTFSEKDGDIITPIGAEGGGGIIFIERSLPDLHIDISNNELVAGATYKITGVHKAHTIDDFPLPISALYDDGRDLGTTIFLKAISENELETFGSGIFYNPKYDKQVQGFGIWSNKVGVSLFKIDGTFELANREDVTADNGAKGRILTKGWIEYNSGDWSGAKSIKGDSSGAEADIGGITVPNYNVDDIVFWGGYAWKNLTGDIGSSIDVLSLDGKWEKLNYDDVNYNKAVDYIEYDIHNDLITRRYDTGNDIDVRSGFFDIIAVAMAMEVGFSPVSLMQWGNDLYFDFSIGSPVGVGTISVKHMSFVELVNFKGELINSVTLDNGSGLFNVTFDNGSYLQNVTFDNGSGLNNLTFDNRSYLQNVTLDNGSRSFNITLNDSSMRNVTFDNGARLENVTLNESHLSDVTLDNRSYLQDVVLNGSNLNNVVLNGSYLRDVTLDNGSYLQYVTFDNNSNLTNVTLDNSNLTNVTLDNGSYLQFVILIGSYLRGVTLIGSRLSGVTLGNKSTMTNNTFVNFISNFNNRTYNTINLSNIKFEGNGGVSSILDLSNATIITDSSIPQKKVFGNDQTTIKIQYWDSVSNDFAIADITD